MAGERRYHAKSDFYRPIYKNLTLARKAFTFQDQQPNAVTAIQPQLSSEQSSPPSKPKADLKRAMVKSTRSNYANGTDGTTISPSSSKRKARLAMRSPLISRQPPPTSNTVNLAMDQAKFSKPSGIHDNSDDLDSPTPASLHFETSTYSSFLPSPSRDSSYSSPPSKPKAPKRTLGAVAKAKGPIPPVLGKRTTKKRPSYSPSVTPSMLYAPWNDHQSGRGDSALLSTSEYQVELGDSEVDHPIKRARRNSLLPESTKLCDNYGCNAMHSHLDCPLGMKCWGCRANTHYTSACPMTCVKCGFAGHAQKFCEDFEIDTRAGIPRPKRHTVQPASAATKLPAMSSEKTYQCDNYPCQVLHSHYDCPLPTICWGCRATDHYWSGCHARCAKCGAERHISKYCNEFEFWMNGKSRPKRSPDEMRRIVSMKRQRQIEMQQVEQSNQQHGLNPKSRSVTSSTPLQPPMKRRASSSSHEQSQFTPTGSRPNEHTTSLGAHHEQTTRSQAIPTQPRITRNHFPMLEHGPNGEKIYCTYWLRTGSCRFSTVGCALKHRVPAEKSLQDGIGIDFHSPWLQDDPVVREYHRKDRGALRSSDRRSGEHGQHELKQQSPLTASHKWVREPPGNQKPIKTSTSPMSPSAREPPTQPAKHIQPAKQSIRDLFKSLDPPSDISESFSELWKSSISKCKTPVISKEPRLLTSESRHQPTTQTESESISPYQTTNVTKIAAPIAPRAIVESLAEMVDAEKKKNAEKEKDVDRKPNTAKEENLLPSTPTHTAAQIFSAPPAPAPVAAPTTSDTLAAKLKAFEEEEFFRQRRHEAEMMRKKAELRLVYEHEKMMAELRRG